MKYLANEQLNSAFESGISVEQWLTVVNDNPEYSIIKWLRIDKEKNETFSVTYFEVFDEGNEEFLDIYEFSPFDPDEAFGEIKPFSTYDQALAYCYEKYNAREDRFVNAGMIQEEYKNYLATRA